MGVEPAKALSLRGLSKTFSGARVLEDVSLDVRPGEIRGLLGANGSGKSTLVKVLAGIHAPDPGATLSLGGRPVRLPLAPGAFRDLGLAFVHQNLGLIPSLTVLENLRMARLGRGLLRPVDWARERAAARETLRAFELAFDLEAPVAALASVDRALLAIVRAFDDLEEARRAHDFAGVMVLDEPTPFLPREGVRKLFDLVRRVAGQGAGVLFISHDVDEVMEITDTLTVLRDGRVSGELVTARSSPEEIVETIVGRALGRARPGGPESATRKGAPFLRLEGVGGGALRRVSLDAGSGEILGITGLIGSGYADIPYLVFGAARASAGALTLGGAVSVLSDMTPRRALAAGMGLLPGDRQGASGVGELSVLDNIWLPSLHQFFRRGRLDGRAMRSDAVDLGVRLDVRPNDPARPLETLSGGNAQKALLGRWLSRRPGLLLLDEPTQGVDVGAREQIFAQLRAAAAEGMTIVCASSDHEQLAALCDRVLVFSRGAIVGELRGAAISKASLARACYGDLDGT